MTERDMELFRDIQEQALQVKLYIEAEQSGTCRAQEAGLMVWWGKLKEQLAETGCGYLCRCVAFLITEFLSNCNYLHFTKTYLALITNIKGAYYVYFLSILSRIGYFTIVNTIYYEYYL